MNTIIKINPEEVDTSQLVKALKPDAYCYTRDLLKIYTMAESLRLNMWSMIQDINEGFNLRYDIKPCDQVLNATASYNDRVLKIVIEDFLPSKSFVENKDLKNEMEHHWILAIRNAIDALLEAGETKANIYFEPAFCQIVTYVPRNADYQPENRVYHYILEALHYSRVFRDNWDKMSFMVVGRIDKKNPRTEVYVSKPEQDLAKFIQV